MMFGVEQQPALLGEHGLPAPGELAQRWQRFGFQNISGLLFFLNISQRKSLGNMG
jgi:hypothetical protein